MFIPIGDDNSDRRLTPVVNLTLIAINILVFFFLQGGGHNYNFTYGYSTVPREILSGRDIVTEASIVQDPASGAHVRVPGLQETAVPVYLTLITAMFMHGGLMHLLGNMLYLFIFGDNIENFLGHARYLLFYLASGVVATLSHILATVFSGGNLLLPMLGASGAIAGVLGGYLLLFPKRKVRVLIFRFITEVPAIAAIGVWFAFQVISGMGALGSGSGGVAYGAHIGGFLAGLFFVKLFSIGR